MRPCKRTSPACGGGGSPDEPDDGKYRRSVFIGALTLGFGLGVALFSSVLFYRGRYAPGFRVAALLFVFSDATIAWNKFVEPLPDATLRIMSTYYAAQYLFALLALAASSRKAAAARP